MKKLLVFFIATFFFLPILIAQQKSVWDRIPEDLRKTKPYQRFEWFYKQRAFPYDTIPQYRYIKEMDLAKENAKSSRNKISSPLVWTSIGPNGVHTSFENFSIVSGRVRAIAVHPTDPLTLYMGAACGGIWKTTDGGENWVNIGDELESLSFGAIDIDPSNPNIIYAGSGEVNPIAGIFHFDGRGLFKSTDAGQSWIQITDSIGVNTHFGDIAVSPHNSNIILGALGSGYLYLGSNLPNEGVWKSSDAGSTWTKTLDVHDAFDIVYHPTNTDSIYAAIGGRNTNSGFYISTDQGETWEQSNNGLPAANTITRIQIDISKSNPGILYAVIFQGTNPFNGVTTAYKSTDGGNNWSHISPGVHLSGYVVGNVWVDQGFYDLCIAVDPSNADHVFIGNVEIHETMNGSDFSVRRIPGGQYSYQSLAHMDYHKLVFSESQPSYFYIGCDGGVFKSTDGGNTVTTVNEGIRTLQFYRIASHPGDPQKLIGGLQDNGVIITAGSGWSMKKLSDGMECFYDYSNPNRVYASFNNGYLLKSENGGDTFNPIYSVNGAWVTPFFIHPTNSDALYTANKRIRVSYNRGSTFTQKNSGGDIAPTNISTMAQSSVDPNHMIFGTGMGDWPGGDSIYVVKVSTDEGVNWNEVTANIPGETRWISRVETDPLDANTMYVLRTGFSPGNKLYKTTDLGQTWINISGNLPDLPCNDIFIHPYQTDSIFVANDIGVYMTTNGGTNWAYASEGIPFVPCIDFDFVTIDSVGYLRVAPHGQSAFQTDFPVTVEEQKLVSELPTSFALLQNYPNPFNPTTTIRWQLAEGSEAKLKVYDILGREVATLVNEYRPTGKYETEFSAGGGSAYGGNAYNQPSGVYFYQLRAGSFVETKKMMLMK